MGKYRLLIIAEPSVVEGAAREAASRFDLLTVCADADAALAQLRHQTYDAIGVSAENDQALLSAHLKALADPTPLFILPAEDAERPEVLRDVRHLLHRLHTDYADESYTLSDMARTVQDEMLHHLLAGDLEEPGKLRRWFTMMRSDIPLDRPCRVYEMRLPQGELYLSDRWHHGQQRLQKALEQNFFGRIPSLSYCAVAFITPQQARLLLLPGQEDIDAETDELDSQVLSAVDDIREYLDLGIDVYQAGTAACLTDIAIISFEAE